MKKRKEFEDAIRRNRLNIGSWLKYASWEESQKELNRYLYLERLNFFIFKVELYTINFLVERVRYMKGH